MLGSAGISPVRNSTSDIGLADITIISGLDLDVSGVGERPLKPTSFMGRASRTVMTGRPLKIFQYEIYSHVH